MRSEGLLSALVHLVVLSIVVVAVVLLLRTQKVYIGPAVIALGFLPWLSLAIGGRSVRSAGADIIFGAVDTGFMAVFAVVGASFAGLLGAIVGSVVGDAITDGLAGLIEGRAAEYLRRHGIEEARTPLSSAMGKMSGCLIGGGITVTVAWSILGL
ncbi:MAG: hypothetical protein SV910_04410 [Chloroflexota bacterium]|nr:hypothetical protein [Chloroflexota bacterium]